MKKLVLAFVFIFTTGAFVNASTSQFSEKNEINLAPDCWAKANAAESAYCGSVGCNFDYWAGYMESCMNIQE